MSRRNGTSWGPPRRIIGATLLCVRVFLRRGCSGGNHSVPPRMEGPPGLAGWPRSPAHPFESRPDLLAQLEAVPVGVVDVHDPHLLVQLEHGPDSIPSARSRSASAFASSTSMSST